MARLPDPRTAAPFPEDHRLASPIRALADASWGGERSRAYATLVGALRKLLARGDEETITSAMCLVPPGTAAGELTRALDRAVNAVEEEDDAALLARVFLLPVLLVTAGQAPARVTGVVPDIGEITELLKKAGALGPVENFGLSNALGSLEAGEAMSALRLFELVRKLGAETGTDLLPPTDIAVDTADERVHLRFLAGVSITPAHVPTFLETAGQVGRWGLPVAQALGGQLGEPGLSLLAIPRAPRPWFTALHEGRFAREEIAFNLFASGAIRRIRSETGEPEATVSARDDGTVRVDLTSPFDPHRVHAHAWRLSAADDLSAVEASIRDLLRDCRVEKVQVHETVLPAEPLPEPGAGGLLPH
jgi:hypothetical protein